MTVKKNRFGSRTLLKRKTSAVKKLKAKRLQAKAEKDLKLAGIKQAKKPVAPPLTEVPQARNPFNRPLKSVT